MLSYPSDEVGNHLFDDDMLDEKGHDHKEKVDVTIFNVYSVEITPNEIIYYINHRKTFSYPRLDPEPEGQYPFDDYEYYMILSAQLGGHWIGPIEAEQLPVKMEVDYVRFYEKR